MSTSCSGELKSKILILEELISNTANDILKFTFVLVNPIFILFVQILRKILKEEYIASDKRGVHKIFFLFYQEKIY